ncbi:MAG: hypothetical protein C4337_05220 [Armatimonadota bacterium]
MGSTSVDRALLDRIDTGAHGLERLFVLIGRKRSRLFLPVPLLIIAFATPSTEAIGSGWALVLIGSLWRLWSAGYLIKNAELITAGPYAFMRHPLYFGMGLVLLGWVTLAGWSWIVTGLLLYAVGLYGCAILMEERRLVFLFPEYAWYRRQVPLIIPLPGRGAKVRMGQFGWRTLAQNGEWRVLMWNVVVALLITLRIEV